MNSRILLAAVVAGLLLAPSGGARAGAWLQSSGSGFWKAALLSQSADQRWDAQGNHQPADPEGSFVQRQLFFYGEMGVFDWLTATGSWAYKDQRIDADRTEYGTRSSGDLRLGARLPLRRGNQPISVEAIIAFPTYERSDLSDPPALRRQYLPAGSGRIESELHVLGGLSLWPLPMYANLDLAYQRRGGAFNDQWGVALEVGGSSPRFFAKTELRWSFPGDGGLGDSTAGDLALGERSVSLAPEVATRLYSKLWLSLGFSKPLSGRNVLDAGQWSLGVILWD